uniref:Helix-turn-helix DNA binding domain n=1 Tax=Mycobacterium phage JustASigh TaxID=3158894 RepID=A0AAU8GM50_9CAUD
MRADCRHLSEVSEIRNTPQGGWGVVVRTVHRCGDCGKFLWSTEAVRAYR